MKYLKPLILLVLVAVIGLCGADEDGKPQARDADPPTEAPARSPHSQLPETSAGVPSAAARVDDALDEDQEDQPVAAEFAAGFGETGLNMGRSVMTDYLQWTLTTGAKKNSGSVTDPSLLFQLDNVGTGPSFWDDVEERKDGISCC